MRIITTLLCLAISWGIKAQTPLKSITHKAELTRRCATSDHTEAILRNDPLARARANSNPLIPVLKGLPSTYKTNAIVTIPVVVHIVMPNANIITDADVNSQIARLNTDFAGLNPDSTNGTPFYSVRGHSQIRFTLARRTPAGTITTGIERRNSSTGSDANAANDPIKYTATGGLNAWDPTAYLNLWIGPDGSGNGILGYAQFPSSGVAAEDGVFLNFQAFGEATCNNISVYNKGRTGTHEVGHYLGLFHIWGDDAACAGDDFANLNTAGSSCVLPSNLANTALTGNTASDVGDTPNQAGETTTCPSGAATDACSLSTQGKMYQNFMDYTQDLCYSMFTAKQVARMEYVIDNCRAGLKTSLGATVPANAPSRDAAASGAVNPGGSELSGCTLTTYPSTLSCAGSITPKIRIANNGTGVLATVTVGMIVNNGAAITVNASPNLVFGTTAVISFPAINVTTGTYTFKFYTSNANGAGTDQVPSNDTITTTLTVSPAGSLPSTQGFETAPFPTPYSLHNPDGDFTWQWVTPGRNSANSAAMDNYNNDGVGKIDDIRSNNLNIGSTDSVWINFDVAHKNYPGSNDRLTVLVSKDCGATFTATTYNKAGATLATAGSSTNAYTTPSATDWRRERVAIGGTFLSTGSIVVAFRNTNAYGNNIFIDNILIEGRQGTIYTFVGSGNWSNAANWENGAIPPATLLAGQEIVINPAAGVCNLDIPVNVTGGKFTVKAEKALVTNGNLTITQ